MKALVPLIFLSVLAGTTLAQNTDLPGPVPNLQTVTAGSYVIPMDNVYQTDNVIGSGNFNLKSYGLIVHLMNNRVKLKWVIRAGKAKDGIDFTGSAEQIMPTFSAPALSRNFVSGPFVIYTADTAGVAALIDNFYSAHLLTGNARPKVFRLSADAPNVDIRYDLRGFFPKAAILTDGGKEDIHVGYMTACGITTTNYALGIGNDLLTKCYTFASEPHNNKSGPAVNAAISAIRSFVNYGGNFLAQCAAVENYENNPLGRFQTTTGIKVENDGIGTALSYPNPDLSFSQFQGSFNGSDNGSVKNWSILGAPINNEHNHATGVGGFSATIGASVSKMISKAGGLVFYLGNHEFLPSDGLTAINGIRMYMNAFLTPVSINRSCNIGEPILTPLPVKLISFTAVPGEGTVSLNWSTAGEKNVSHFAIERSVDGQLFEEIGQVSAFGNSSETRYYSFTDGEIIPGQPESIFYRIRSVDTDGSMEYSGIKQVVLDKLKKDGFLISIFPNPVSGELNVRIPSKWEGRQVTIEIVGQNGQLMVKKEARFAGNSEKLDVRILGPGYYLVRAQCQGEILREKIIKR